MTTRDSAAPRPHRWHEEPGGWSCACGVICEQEAAPCDRHGECKIGRERTSPMPEVRIDGVLHVPVSEAHIDAGKVTDALVKQWGGDGWQRLYPDAPNYLRVVVSDTFEEGEGESVADFVARIIANI